MEAVFEILKNTDFAWGIMSIIVLCLSQILKLPIKCLTSKIKNNEIRQMVNTTILLIPLALGVGIDWAFCTYYLGIAFSITEGVKVGATAVTLYAALEKVVKGVVSSGTKATLELAEDITDDGKVDGKDLSAVERFMTQVK